MTAARVPPHSVEAEQAVIGGLMLDNGSWSVVDGNLDPEHFYRHDHRRIFEAVQTLAKRSDPFDLVTVAEQLQSAGKLKDAGGLAYLGELASGTPSAANIRAYMKIVLDRCTLRRIIAIGDEAANKAFDPGGASVADLLLDLEAKAQKLTDEATRSTRDTVGIKDALMAAIPVIEDLHEHPRMVSGLASGYQDLDEITTGFYPGDLVILAGRPGNGKTTLAMNIAEHAAMKGEPALVFSMEMPTEQLTLRLLASMGRIDFKKLRTGRLEEADWPRLTSAASQLSESPLFMNANPVQTVGTIRAEARRVAKLHGKDGKLGLIVVDYLTKIHADGENQNLRVANVVQGLKAVGMELKVPVLVLAQLNREVTKTNRKPVSADIRDSGVVEQEADVILLLHREELTNEDTPRKGVADLIVDKQRNGETGSLQLTFRGRYLRFENYHVNVDGGGNGGIWI